MASTFTSRIRLNKQGDGDNPNSWGVVLNDGVISLFTATTADLGIASFSGDYFNVTGGVVSSNIASSSSYGVVKVDNNSIKLNDKNQIYGLGEGSRVVASDKQSAESGGFYYSGGILYYKT